MTTKFIPDNNSFFQVIDQAYLNNLRAMKVNIPGPSRVNVPEPFRGDVPIGRERSSGLTSTRSSW